MHLVKDFIPSVTIIGSGIAGLSVAIFLLKKGFRVTLLEKSSELPVSGAGIQLSPNATYVLKKLDLLDGLMKTAFFPKEICFYDAKLTKKLLTLPVSDYANKHFKTPYAVINRTELQNLLFEKFKTFKNAQVFFTCKINSITETHDLVTTHYTCGPKKDRITSQFFIGCDGVGSYSRRFFFPEEICQFSGYVAWRSILNRQNLSHLSLMKNVNVWLAPQTHAIFYPISNSHYLNMVFITKTSLSILKDSSRDRRHYFFKYTQNWTSELKEILHSCQWTPWPIFHSFNVRYRKNNKIFYIGDAAHALSPFSGQGGAMALEDAYLLANRLLTGQDLDHFVKERLKRLRKVTFRTEFNKMVYHLPFSLSFFRNFCFQKRNPSSFLKDLDWLYSYSPDSTIF